VDNINTINDNVFEFLEEYKDNVDEKEYPFLFTLRKTDQRSRLQKGYWFHGNDRYIAVSFWDGNDWKNKTPNIFLRITTEGRSFLSFTSKDSIQKLEVIKNYFVGPLDLMPDGKDRWVKEYVGKEYMQVLRDFILNDKLRIDQIIQENLIQIRTEDSRNSLGFIDIKDFEKWLNNVQKYRDDDNVVQLPFCLTSFNVEKYTPISQAGFGRLTKNIPFIFLVGNNGSGKSSLLKAMSIALGNQYYQDGIDPNSPWIINYSVSVSGKTKRNRLTAFDPQNLEIPKIPFAAYGPSRLIINNRKTRNPINEIGEDRTSPLWCLFHPDAILKDINRWIIDQLSLERNNEGQINAQTRFDNIKLMLISIIPNLYDIREVKQDNGQELLYYEEDLSGNNISKGLIFEHLSSGFKSLIAMIGDMMLRLFEQQPELTDPAELAGIVLIDEIDIHLHPQWQKKVPMILNDNFPKIQFIVSTHSPIPLLGTPKKSRIYVVSRRTKDGIYVERMDDKVMFNQILPNAILTSPIFGLQDITPVSKDDNRQTRVEDDFSEIQIYDKIEKDVELYLSNSRQKELVNLFKKNQ
jgi:predicted ATPase